MRRNRHQKPCDKSERWPLRFLMGIAVVSMLLLAASARANKIGELFARMNIDIDSEDLRLFDEIDKKAKTGSIAQADAELLNRRAWANFNNGNFFAARFLFFGESGARMLLAKNFFSEKMNEPAATAWFYSVMSLRKICEAGTVKCTEFAMGRRDKNFPDTANAEELVAQFTRVHEQLNVLPTDLRAAVRKECVEARERYRHLLQSNPGYRPSPAEDFHAPDFYCKDPKPTGVAPEKGAGSREQR